jgi:hypothetical protein
MKICLVQYNPFYPKVGMLDSYNEVVESYVWGFTALGYDVKRLINHFDPDALNIVFGFFIPYQLGLIDTFPANTIFLNLERHTHFELATLINTPIDHVASKYQIWDYDQGNVAVINALNPKFPAYYAKISYAPNLEKIPNDAMPEIDVLYYGGLSSYRYDALSRVAAMRPDFSGLSVMVLRNVWGKLRDEFIARSKVIINISGSGSAFGGSIFEIVRVSYLLANKKAVVCVKGDEHDQIEADLLSGPLKFVNTSEIQNTCQTLIEDDTTRAQYAEQCYDLFRKRDIREVITQYFA